MLNYYAVAFLNLFRGALFRFTHESFRVLAFPFVFRSTHLPTPPSNALSNRLQGDTLLANYVNQPCQLPALIDRTVQLIYYLFIYYRIRKKKYQLLSFYFLFRYIICTG